jgi:hypothetical protein
MPSAILLDSFQMILSSFYMYPNVEHIYLFRCWAAFDLYGMAEEVAVVGAEALLETRESKEGRTEKWNEEDETKSAKSNKDVKVII